MLLAIPEVLMLVILLFIITYIVLIELAVILGLLIYRYSTNKSLLNKGQSGYYKNKRLGYYD